MSCELVAPWNQGKDANGTNSFSSPSRSQNPWGDASVTSTEMSIPSATTFVGMSLNQILNDSQLLFRQASILRQRNHGLKPEFGFPVRTSDVNVHLTLLAGEEVKPVGSVTKYGGAHFSPVMHLG